MFEVNGISRSINHSREGVSSMLTLFCIMSVVSVVAFSMNKLEERKEEVHKYHSWSTSVLDEEVYCTECNKRSAF